MFLFPLVSETHQQIHSKQSINSMTTTNGKKKKNRAKLKRKKVASLNETVMNESEMDQSDDKSGSGSNLLYNINNTFRKPKIEGKGATGKKSANDQQRYRSETSGTLDEEEFEENDYETEDDYAHYGANAAFSLQLSLFASLSLIVCALFLGY